MSTYGYFHYNKSQLKIKNIYNLLVPRAKSRGKFIKEKLKMLLRSIGD